MVAKKPEMWGHCPQCNLYFKKKVREPRQYTNGEPRMQVYCSKVCSNTSRSKGFHLDKHGYRILNNGEKGGYKQPEHRAVMERIIGRRLAPNETVHHKNGVRHDNRPENLELWSSRHGRGQRVADQLPHRMMAAPGSFSGLLSFSA